MKAIKLSSRHVKVGDTLKWDVLDDRGRLLLKKGAVITSGKQCLLLIEQGIVQVPDEEPREEKATRRKIDISNPFEVIEQCAFSMSKVFYKLTQQEDVKSQASTLVQALMVASKKDSDAAIGAVHLLHGHAYTTIHPIHTAALCYSLCEALKLDDAETHRIMLAALTSNIGMLELQEELHHQVESLSDEQFQQIRQHPQESVRILQASGLNDEKLLEIIMQHHERSHGEGYPNGLKCEEICQGAKMVALADVYSAMISPRSYRETVEASSALKTLFLERGKEYDETLAVMLIKHMGVYPPGSFVQLANGETAVVVRRTEDKMTPQVACVTNNKGMPYSRPISRDSREAAYNIKGMVSPKHQINLNLANVWGYN
jgi:HD-GYP domain-containing protein (c-di-GMP phosphodiesterase class II)